jgi:hypothetical protein
VANDVSIGTLISFHFILNCGELTPHLDLRIHTKERERERGGGGGQKREREREREGKATYLI